MSLTVYQYDGSLEGLLTAFAEALENDGEDPDFTGSEAAAATTLFGPVMVETRPAAAAELVGRLEAAGGVGVPRLLVQAHLAEQEGLERWLYQYVRLTLQRQQCVDGWLSHPAVAAVHEATRRVGREVHRFMGLLRFHETSTGVYYAAYEPDHNITLPLCQHFRARLADQRWLIHDRRRDLAVLWDGAALHPARLNAAGAAQPGTEPTLSAAEAIVQEEWRTYHRRIAIAGRRNPTLQRQFMPQRYWRYLVEMQGG